MMFMVDSIGNLLHSKAFQEPDELLVIREFLRENYKATCQLTVGPRQIVIAVKGASLAGAIRMRLHELQALCQTDKRLVLRIIG